MPKNSNPRVAYGAPGRNKAADTSTSLYELTIEEAQNLIRSHGRVVPRERTLQLYCANHDIDACKASTTRHGKTIQFWLINRASLLKWISDKPRIVVTAEHANATAEGKSSLDLIDLPSLQDVIARPLAERKRAAQLLRDVADLLAR